MYLNKKKTIIWHSTHALKKKWNFYFELKKKNHYTKFNPCIPKKKKTFPFAVSLPNVIKLILKENFCIFPERNAEISVLFRHFQISRSSPNSLLSFLSLHLRISDWISTHSDSTQFQSDASQVRDQVISSSLISDPPVLAPISGASP